MDILLRNDPTYPNYGISIPPEAAYVFNLGHAHGHPPSKDAREFAARLYKLGVLREHKVGLFCFTNSGQAHERKILKELGFTQHLNGYMCSHSVDVDTINARIEELVDTKAIDDALKGREDAFQLLEKTLREMAPTELRDVLEGSVQKDDQVIYLLGRYFPQPTSGYNGKLVDAMIKSIRSVSQGNLLVLKLNESPASTSSSSYYSMTEASRLVITGKWGKEDHYYMSGGYRRYFLKVPSSIPLESLVALVNTEF